MRVEQVFITPLIGVDIYGDEVEVSDYVKIDGLSKIKRSIDSTDYSIGVYRFNDLKLKCDNSRGVFNENDSRSIFPFTRDKAKVRVVALEIDNSVFPAVTTAETQFDGLINDEATRQNITTDVVSITALSKDSVFRTTPVQAGIVSVGTPAKDALFSILSQPEIRAILTVLEVNINPEFNFIIDDPEELDSLEVNKALDLILAASSSVLLIENDTVYVQGRENTSGDPPLELRGRGEISNNANIISISEYNSGKQRQFNGVVLNDGAVIIEDTASISQYGLRQIEFDFPIVNNIQTLEAIGESIADEFRFPKIELKLRVPTNISSGAELLDLVRVDAPWLRKPLPGDFLPIVGVAVLGDAETPLPEILGSVQVLSKIKFKIISIEDNPKTFITILKLRQTGKLFNDGVYT